MNQEESEQNEVGGMKKGVDSTHNSIVKPLIFACILCRYFQVRILILVVSNISS